VARYRHQRGPRTGQRGAVRLGGGRVGRRTLPALPLLAGLLVPAAALAQGSYPQLRVLGFYDVNFFATDEETGADTSAAPGIQPVAHGEAAASGGATSGFRQGQFVVHAIAALSQRTSFFSEISLSPRSDQFRVEVERAIVKFEFNNLLALSAGRYHTPVNWWNAAFHHGLWLQTTISRPEMTQFGGDFIPVHFVGVLAQGGVDGPGVSLDYELGLGNGRDEAISRAGDAGDANQHRAWLGHVFLRPDRLYQLKGGVAYYRDRVGMENADQFGERIVSAYLVFTRETPEVLAEVAWIDHEPHALAGETDSHGSMAYYVQAAYRLPWLEGALKPYARLEELDIEDEDPVFSGIHDLRLFTLGVRADVTEYAALKAEYRRRRVHSDPTINGFFTQVSLVFH